MLTQTDALAAERFRTILAEGVRQTGYDAYGAGQEADPERVAHAVLDDFSEFRFERRVNEHGVAVRRVVVASGWEVDPTLSPIGLEGDADCVCNDVPLKWCKAKNHSYV